MANESLICLICRSYSRRAGTRKSDRTHKSARRTFEFNSAKACNQGRKGMHWEGENEKDSSEAPEDDLLVIKESFDLPYPQSEISHPAQPLPLFRPPSTIPSEDSDIEQTADTTLDYSETSQRSRVFRPPSLHSEDSDLEDSSETEPNPGANAEEQGVEDDSDSSADEIVNQLRGTTLADKRKEQPTSSPISRTILGTPSRTYSPKADPSSHRKPQTSFSTDQVSPAKEQSPSHSAQRAYHNPTARASSPTSTSASEESLVNEDYEINHRNPTSHNDESLRADEDPEVLQSQSAIDNEDHSLVEEQSFIAEQSFVGETVSAWKAICNLYIFKSATTSFERWETGARAELWVSAPENPQSDICWLTVKPPGVDDDDLRCVISTPIGSEQNLSFSGVSVPILDTISSYHSFVIMMGDVFSQLTKFICFREAFCFTTGTMFRAMMPITEHGHCDFRTTTLRVINILLLKKRLLRLYTTETMALVATRPKIEPPKTGVV
ncbi:hypothetical protein PGTUg99_017417 [Puccinia graminis f. sp. tritici]|uniref:Uncharacterized protein n=1 Tax=Puccinia graminis f. sp. tritici TaxID=56615 RepID=A0A5B0MAE2_PUCGR|nr:hypothetical protein PGTUg99_017417 [Puccinia graminis f. sp. tritici]